VHGVRSRLRNTLNVARNARVDVRHVAFSGLCAALAVLTPADKQNGVLVIDLGGGTTSYVVYAAGMIAAAGCLALGGDHLTNDVARGFSITQVQAESLKEAYGSAEIDLAARAQKLDVKNDSGASRRPVRLGDLQLITSMRAAEILELVRSEIRPELLGHLGAGVVLTGGGAHLRNMTALGAKTFGMPCQLGKARDVSGIAMATSGTAYAAPLGLLRYAVRTGYRDEERVSLSGIIKKILGMG
jgi:cell division protein FtsA